MRLLSGTGLPADEPAVDEEHEWAGVTPAEWLAGTLQALREPEALARVDPGDSLRTALRPYQQTGVRWLHFLSSLGLGACLADDMELGKTHLCTQAPGSSPRRARSRSRAAARTGP